MLPFFATISNSEADINHQPKGFVSNSTFLHPTKAVIAYRIHIYRMWLLEQQQQADELLWTNRNSEMPTISNGLWNHENERSFIPADMIYFQITQ